MIQQETVQKKLALPHQELKEIKMDNTDEFTLILPQQKPETTIAPLAVTQRSAHADKVKYIKPRVIVEEELLRLEKDLGIESNQTHGSEENVRDTKWVDREIYQKE